MAWLGLVVVVCLATAGCHAGNDACASGPCQSGATCIAKGSTSYSCNCPSGYAGVNCQFQVCDQWSNAISSGTSSENAAGLDGSQRWTMVRKEGFSTGGTLIGFKFYTKYIRPLTIGIYRPTGGVCSFTVVALFTASINEIGPVTHSLTVDEQIEVQQNDTVGITWTAYGVVPYDTVTPYLYCDSNQSPPSVGGVIKLDEKKFGQRGYSIEAMIVPKNPILPGPYLGYPPFPRAIVSGGQLWTMVQTKGFPLAGTLTGFEFYVQAVRPVQLGLYRPISGCTFTLLKSWSPAVSSVGYVKLSFTGNEVAQFQQGDTIGLTWTNYGQIPYDNADDFNYCDAAIGQPAVGEEQKLVAGRYGNRFYSLRAIVQFKMSDSCSSNPCQNGGACCNSGDSYYCQCPFGTVQPNCARATNCLQSPCLNGGTCVTVTKTSYTCTCLPGYSGANCETIPCDRNGPVQSIGYTAANRPGLDGGLRTMVQLNGFPTAGVITGYRFYAQVIKNLQVGLYRPLGSCRFKLLKSWTRAVINEGVQTVEFSLSEQANFEAGDTIGFTWSNGGVVPFNDNYGSNYCEDDVAQTAVGSTIALGVPTYGKRVYSFEALYIANGPGPAPSFLGFSVVPAITDGAALYTFVQIRGFQTAGTLIGFKFMVSQAARPLQLGLYRPVPGTCTYQLLKGWTPYINSIGVMELYFSTGDRANFQVGDTFGFSWSNGGVIPYDSRSADYNYCENTIAQPAVGTIITLVPGRYGNRFYSIQALYVPTPSSTICLAATDCSPNPCMNGGTCDLDDHAGYVCTCPEDYSGDNCEVPPAAEPCGVAFNVDSSQYIGYQAFDRLSVDGTVYTNVQSQGFPSAGILTGFQFYAKYVRPLTLGLYRRIDGCTFTLIKSFVPSITSVGVVTYQLSAGHQVSFQAGDTIGFSGTSGGVITYDAASTNDYLYCENNVSPPSVGRSFTLMAGRYGNRLYSIRALYTPTSVALQPLTLGWNAKYRGGSDGNIVWTYVQIEGFQTDGTLLGFRFFVSNIRPLTLGLYRPLAGTCSFLLLKVYTPPIVNTGFNTFTLSPSDQYKFQKGDTIGLTWTNYGVVSQEAATGYMYCEDRQAVSTEGATVNLINKRYGQRFFSFHAQYRPVTSSGFYVDYCASNPCKNGGTCCSTTTSFTCTCPANTLPPDCHSDDPCKAKPCANGGACTKLSDTTFSCACKVGYDGDSCTTVVPNPCNSSPCKNGGTCTRLDNTNFACQCSSKYIGSTCQTAIQPCSSSPCKNGGTCVGGSGSSFTCSCKIGFSDSTCNTVVPDPCAAKPCKNGGVCTRLDNTNFSCQCGSSYTGSTCETALPCASSPCQNGGTCSNAGTEYDCNCPDDYNDGDTCSTYQDPCESRPCLNGGTCTRQTWNTFTCTCPTGRVGELCELDPTKAPCENDPCQHSGTCTNGEGLSYTCKCPRMWEGNQCEKVHCLTDPAQCLAYTLGGRFANCDSCLQFVACRKKRQRIVTCSNGENLYFDRSIRKCTNNTITACAGL